jgi:hypothetical protein
MMGLKLICLCLIGLSAGLHAQEIIKLPPGAGGDVSRPDDLFELPAGEWHFAKQLWQGRDACTEEQCEAGFTTGDLVVSAEHAGKFVRIIAGLRNCPSAAFSEMETGKRPSKSMRKRVAKQVQTVVKGLGKTCRTALPAVTPLDVALLFPPRPGPGPADPS